MSIDQQQKIKAFSTTFSQPSVRQIRPLDKRKFRRYRHTDAARCYAVDSIGVRLTTLDRRHGAHVVDLSSNGVGVLMSTKLEIGSPIGIELRIGEYTLECFGQVRNATIKNNAFKVGIQFLYIGSAEKELLCILDRHHASRTFFRT